MHTINSLRVARFAALVGLAGLAACSDDPAPKNGVLEDQVAVTTTDVEQTLTLGKGVTKVEIEVPANALPASAPMNVRLLNTVVRKGATPVGSVVEITPSGLVFLQPVKSRQHVPPPAIGKRYAVVHAAPEGDTWIRRSPGRRISTATDDEIWELDIDGSGLNALVLEDLPGVDAGMPLADQTSIETGPKARTIIVGSGPTRTTLNLPANALPTRQILTMDLSTGIPAADVLGPSDGLALTLTPAGLTFTAPIKARRPVSAPPVGKSYVAVTAATSAGPWVMKAPARLVPAAVAAERSPSPLAWLDAPLVGPTQTYDVPRTAPSPGLAQTGEWEIDIDATGAWGFALVDIKVDLPPPVKTARLTINPTTNDFGTVVLGTQSPSFTFTVTNTGDAPSGVLAASLTAAEDFFIVATRNTCTASLGVGASCAVAVYAMPASAGAKTGTLTVASPVPGETVSATVTATGARAPMLTIAPATLTFPATALAATSGAMSMTVTNSGDVATGPITVVSADAAQFPVTTTCAAALVPGGTCTVSAQFSPRTAGDLSAKVTVSAAPGGVAVADLTGKGLRPAALGVAPTMVDFGGIGMGSLSAPHDIVISNTGEVDAPTPGVALAGPDARDFAIASNDCPAVLSGGASCTIKVTMTPATTGPLSAQVDVTFASKVPQSVMLAGTGLSPAALSFVSPQETTVYFYETMTNGACTGPIAFTVNNDGPAASEPLTFTFTAAMTADLDDFVVDMANPGDCPGARLAPGANCTVNILFCPNNDLSHYTTVNVSAPHANTASKDMYGYSS